MENTFRKINNKDVLIETVREGEVSPTLTPGVYSVKLDDKMGFYLSHVSDTVSLPEKIYQGKNSKILLKDLLFSYECSKGAMGIIAVGNKGGSKTTTANQIGKSFIENGLPVILVEEQFAGSMFYDFIDSIGECMIIFDEFTKVYWDNRKSEALLPMFDGRSNVKRLNMIIDNELRRFSTYMLGRPNRFRYLLTYGTIDPEIIDLYLKDNIKKGAKARQVKELTDTIKNVTMLNFDTLSSIVEEFNRFPDRSLKELLNRLNIDFIEYAEEADASKATYKDKRVKEIKRITVYNNEIEVDVVRDDGVVIHGRLRKIEMSKGIITGILTNLAEGRGYGTGGHEYMNHEFRLSFPFTLSPTEIYTWTYANQDECYDY